MKSRTIFAAALIITFGGILIADGLGFWQTTGSKQPAAIKSGDFAGLPNPEDIRGSYSFMDIENAFGIEPAILAKAFNVKTDTPDTVKAKDIEEMYLYLGKETELGTGSVRLFVCIYKGIPYTAPEYLPSTAVTVLKEHGKWNNTLEKDLAKYIIKVDGETTVASPPAAEEKTEAAQESTGEITGKTTVKDVIGYGLTLAEVEAVMGVKIQNENLPIRDICEQAGLSFSTIKPALIEKLAKK